MKKLMFYSDKSMSKNDMIDKELIAFFDKKNPSIGYIPSCLDPERKFYKEQKAYYANLDMNLSCYYGLNDVFNSERIKRLFSCDAIHLSGGNTYEFLYWLKKKKMLVQLRNYVEGGGVLIGVSAGAIIMTRDVELAVLCGDQPVQAETDHAALDLVDFAFFPHYKEE